MSKPTGEANWPERGRWSSRRKMEMVLRVLRGEDLDALTREPGVTAATIAGWRDQFLASGQAGLRARPTDERDEEIARLAVYAQRARRLHPSRCISAGLDRLGNGLVHPGWSPSTFVCLEQDAGVRQLAAWRAPGRQQLFQVGTLPPRSTRRMALVHSTPSPIPARARRLRVTEH